jgi:hypothetical protein
MLKTICIFRIWNCTIWFSKIPVKETFSFVCRRLSRHVVHCPKSFEIKFMPPGHIHCSIQGVFSPLSNKKILILCHKLMLCLADLIWPDCPFKNFPLNYPGGGRGGRSVQRRPQAVTIRSAIPGTCMSKF